MSPFEGPVWPGAIQAADPGSSEAIAFYASVRAQEMSQTAPDVPQEQLEREAFAHMIGMPIDRIVSISYSMPISDIRYGRDHITNMD